MSCVHVSVLCVCVPCAAYVVCAVYVVCVCAVCCVSVCPVCAYVVCVRAMCVCCVHAPGEGRLAIAGRSLWGDSPGPGSLQAGAAVPFRTALATRHVFLGRGHGRRGRLLGQ